MLSYIFKMNMPLLQIFSFKKKKISLNLCSVCNSIVGRGLISLLVFPRFKYSKYRIIHPGLCDIKVTNKFSKGDIGEFTLLSVVWLLSNFLTFCTLLHVLNTVEIFCIMDYFDVSLNSLYFFFIQNISSWVVQEKFY